MITTSSERLYSEVTYLAFHLHWDLDTLLDLEHPLRRRFVDEVRRLVADTGRDPWA